MSINKADAKARMNSRQPGVVHGLIYDDPGSSTLTATYHGGEVRVKSATAGKEFDAYVIASSTKAFTASKDTYVYIDGSTGALSYKEVANAAAKPIIGTDIAANSQFIALVVTDGSRITAGAVTDLREMSGAQLESIHITQSFLAANLGVATWVCPWNGRILHMRGFVSTAIAGTDNGTITAAIGVNNVFTNVTTGVVTYTASDALSVVREAHPTALTIFKAGDVLKFTPAKSTSGGAVELQVLLEKLA